MMAPVSGAVIRHASRTAAVAAIALPALVLFMQTFVGFGPNLSALPDFWTMANVVLTADARAHAAGISRGDRIDYSLMPMGERYGSFNDGLRAPPAGKSVSYVVEHQGRRHVVALAAAAADLNFSKLKRAESWRVALVLLMFVALNAIFFVLVLLGSALAVVRPSALTAAFLLFAAQFGAILPQYYSFLPSREYAAVMVVSDILAGLGAVGFLGVGLYLDPKRRLRSHKALVVGAVLLTLIVAPVAISDVLELTVGTRPTWPLAGWASFMIIWLCYVTGIFFLVRLAASKSASRIVRIVGGLLASIGAVTLFNDTVVAHNNVWYFANLPSAAMNRWLFPDPWGLPHFPSGILRMFGSLLALFLIVRANLVDVGPVLGRMVAYVIIVLLVVTIFASADIALARLFPGYVLLVPIEVFMALAIGYWMSGLRDVAGCLSLASADAWRSWAKGHARDERDALTHALRLAERTRRPGLIAEVRAQIAFSSWRDGDEPEFEENARALVRVVGNRNLSGLRGFALAATSDTDERCFENDDLAEWKARTALLRCAATNDAAWAQRYAVDALASANDAGLDSLQVLASIAVAETSPDQRYDSLERAHAIARDAGWPALSKSILALRANARDIGILQSFVEVRLRKSRPARPAFEISFFNAELRQNGTRIPLAENELELLFAVASARAGASDVALIDELWPESDGDAARNAFRVCLHRLRKKSGDARIVTRVGKGYVVHPWADVDLWRFQSLIAACRQDVGRLRGPELHGLCDALRAGEGRRATLGEWFHRFEQVLTEKLDEAEQLLHTVYRRA